MKCWCNATIGSSEPEIKEHVRSCNYYLKRCFFYNCIDRIPPEASESDMKVTPVASSVNARGTQASLGGALGTHQEEIGDCAAGEEPTPDGGGAADKRLRGYRHHRSVYCGVHGVQQKILFQLRRAESVLCGGVLAPVLQALHR